jgi:hypothetical protein
MRKPIKSSAKKTTKNGAKRKTVRTSAKKTAVKAQKKGLAKNKVVAKRSPRKAAVKKISIAGRGDSRVPWLDSPKGCCTVVPRIGPDSQIPGITEEACRAIQVHAHNDVVTHWNPGDCYQNN